jgi:preprotein translocase subunit SecB
MRKQKRRKLAREAQVKQGASTKSGSQSDRAASSAHVVPVRLQAVALRGVSYREVEGLEVSPSEQPPAIAMETSINVILNILEDRLVELRMNYVVRPDKRYRPVEIEVQMSALFIREEGLPLRAALEFANRSGGLILYPYIREMISSVTSRGIFQPILLGLIPQAQLFSAEQLDEMEVNAKNAAGTTR